MQTLDHLHRAAYLVHMDLNPQNIIKQHPGVAQSEWDELRLIDFGLAKDCSPGRLLLSSLQQNQKSCVSHMTAVHRCWLVVPCQVATKPAYLLACHPLRGLPGCCFFL